MPITPEGPAGERKFEMSEREIEQVLTTAKHGVLSLASDDRAYAVPMSYGYDGEGLYFIFRRPATGSRKLEFIRETDRATFVVSSMTTKHDWASVVVEGPVVPVEDDGWADLLEAFGEDVWFPSIFSETDPREDFIGYYLVAERVTGRRGADYAFEA
ncbi:MAG: pyridoxamine 5'-phosphate oxidase family protein [Halobacteriales archaeon]|nr:pyridoxamine 5'-phosphate oxidase family protein [Halobacteriales archaeon]